MLGQVSGIDAPTRALERLAKSAEHAAAFLDRLDTEVGLERAAATLDRLDRLADVIEDMHRSLREIEERVVELHLRVDKPFQRLSPLRRQ
jgi:Mg2+ and Co2+ transporter CorA